MHLFFITIVHDYGHLTCFSSQVRFHSRKLSEVQTFDSNPESGDDVLTSACTSLNFSCLELPSKVNKTDSLVVMNAPLCRRR